MPSATAIRPRAGSHSATSSLTVRTDPGWVREQTFNIRSYDTAWFRRRAGCAYTDGRTDCFTVVQSRARIIPDRGTLMIRIDRRFALVFVAPAVGALFFGRALLAQPPQHPPKYPSLPSETPAEFKPMTDGFDYVRRDVMIAMRDGVKLHTVVIVPTGATDAPILLTRTPYDASALTSHTQSSHLGPILNGYDNATDVIVEDGYIRVIQDIPRKYKSEGDYVMNRPLRGPLNATPVDHATDTFDTIDWLVKHVPESNGRA